MFRRSSLALVVLAACGGAEQRDTTPVVDDKPTCPSDAAPERCRELADAAASAGKRDLAWAYTVLECQSPTGAECAPMWHPRLLPLLKQVQLTLVIGQYAQAGLLGVTRGTRLTDTVLAWRGHLARGYLPLPHPSPRNRLWLVRNPWFETELLPLLRERVADALRATG